MTYNTDIERLNFYEGEYLGAADFLAEQVYHRDMRRRHNIGQHTWGIVSGLEIAQISNGGKSASGQDLVDVVIQPGMAVDAFGREIVVLSKIPITQDLLSPYYDSNPAAPPRPMKVWIAFQQSLLAPSADQCASQNVSNAFGRVQENWRIVVTPPSGVPGDDPIMVDGTSMTIPVQPSTLPPPGPPPANPGDVVLPYDGSVPFQEFPDDDAATNWYVPLGRVMWDPHNDVFVKQDPLWAADGRYYSGVVASAIYAPGDSLSISERFAPTPLPKDTADLFYPGVKVDVAGSLTVERRITAQQDVWLSEPGHLEFANSSGGDGDTGLSIHRVSNTSGGADLRVHIGDGKNPATTPQRFVVAYGKDDASEIAAFDVRSDGNVDIPVGSLSFGSRLTQMLNLWDTSYGIGVQADTLYLRSGSDFCWYLGGKPANARGDGGGGILSMKLDNFSNLSLAGNLYLNGPRTYLSGKDGVNEFWMMSGGMAEPANQALGFNPASKQVKVGANWTLDVEGNHNLMFAWKATKVVQNAGMNDPGSWSVNYAGIFSRVYTAFAVFQGFSLWGNADTSPNPQFMSFDHQEHVENIPQHAFVRLDHFDNNGAYGVAYCSESDETVEDNNCVLFTVIVLGQPAI